jgi:hypothetical protein
LLVRDDDGVATYYLLLSEDDEPVNDRVIALLAEPVEITGRVMRRGDLLSLSADPKSYRRLE